jgi:hypothetical protein
VSPPTSKLKSKPSVHCGSHVDDGLDLASAADVVLPSDSSRLVVKPAVTVEDKAIADLIRDGLLHDAFERRGVDVNLDDIARSEPAYTIRYTSTKRKGKGKGKGKGKRKENSSEGLALDVSDVIDAEEYVFVHGDESDQSSVFSEFETILVAGK